MTVSNGRIPGIAECAALMDQHGMLTNIRQHSLAVAKLADQIVTGLTRNADVYNSAERKLVIAGALLHDIAKTPCLNGSCNHAAVGAEICRENNFHETAAIVEEHVILQSHEPARYKTGEFWAGEIVYYADKRVLHDKIVSLKERLEYILVHYGKGDSKRNKLIKRNFSRCSELEFYLRQWSDSIPE